MSQCDNGINSYFFLFSFKTQPISIQLQRGVSVALRPMMAGHDCVAKTHASNFTISRVFVLLQHWNYGFGVYDDLPNLGQPTKLRVLAFSMTITMIGQRVTE